MADRMHTNRVFTNAGAKATNPTTASVLADTGALVAGQYQFRVACGANAAAIFDIQHRNAANDGNITNEVPIVFTPANASGEFIFDFQIAASERVRVVPNANITGDAAVTIQWERIT